MEELHSRHASEAPSSPSDFYTTEHPDGPGEEEQPVIGSAVLEQPTADSPDGLEGNNDDEDGTSSSSEMDVSAPSRSASPEPENASSRATGAKRKLRESLEHDEQLQNAKVEPAQKPRLSWSPEYGASAGPSVVQRLPSELWQHVFLYLSPAMLCRCLRVSKTFNACLTSMKAQAVPKKDQARVRSVDSEAIWVNARKTYCPNMPRPLARFHELQMLQLIGGRTCQFCGRPPVSSPATTPFNAGPGADGLRVVWPFGIRACGLCLERNTVKDVEILVSPAAPLRVGLPYAFRTPDLHFVPELTRQLPGGIPSHLRVAKVYYNKDVEAIQREYDAAKDFGQGAAEEWRKGLATKGKEAMADASRWEKWEGQVRFGANLAHVLREYDLSSFPHYLEEVQSRSAGVNGAQPLVMVNGSQPAQQQPVPGYQNGFATPYQASSGQFQPMPRTIRNPQEVEEARAARKADIERRCLELEPPLQANVLQHIESFQAAMQLTTPVTDAAWEMLKPRILAQRETAELIEHQRAEQLAALQAAVPSVVPDETFTRPAKEVYDKEYEQAQEPLRKKLGEYADDMIDGRWHGGQGLDRDTAPTFAIQVMQYVRQRYEQDKAAGYLKFGSPARSNGSKPETPPPEPFLSLDNMKWVYDNKVRTFTDQHRRELFICEGCAEERKPKWFAFEGLIQHYGAKHTTEFSKGNIVVHWQTAEWPDKPPFHVNPSPWIKLDRKISDFKSHHRTRGTPQANHEGPYVLPSPGVLLSENPLFASPLHQQPPSPGVYYHGQQNYTGLSQHLQPGQHAPPHQGYSYQAPASAQPPIDTSYNAQVAKLATDAREIWDSLEGVRELLECVRTQTMIHHIVARFTERFRHQPNLDLLTDALATNPLMKPVKNAHGLACQICVASQTDGSQNYQSYFARIRNVKLFNASSLITHFKIRHQPREDMGHLDWAKNMIELPETQLISDLIRAPGMDDDKLAVVAAAFPTAFPSPLPRIGLVHETTPDIGPDSGLATRLLDRLNKKPKDGRKKKGQQGPNGTPGRESSQEPFPEPTEDEYDPRRPMYVQSKEQANDPARFDTDISRKAAAPAAFNLAPETLAALSSLNALTAQQAQQPAAEADRRSRSPSVGCAEQKTTKITDNGASGVPAVQPDIAAILASLTGHQQLVQPGTPSATVSDRSGSAPRLAPPDPFGPLRQAPAYLTEGGRRSSGHYVHPEQRASAESPAQYDNRDLQSMLTRNARQYEQNEQLHTYVEGLHAPQQRSPPRYRYVYEDEQAYSQPAPQHAPVYREAPVQYVQVPEHQPAHALYQYEQRPARRPVYMDEYGRPVELIPIDSAPAPVQYAPHPYEQQQQQQYARRTESVAYSAAPYGHPQPAYDHRQPVYYEQPAPMQGRQPSYMYDNGTHSSVPRT